MICLISDKTEVLWANKPINVEVVEWWVDKTDKRIVFRCRTKKGSDLVIVMEGDKL